MDDSWAKAGKIWLKKMLEGRVEIQKPREFEAGEYCRTVIAGQAVKIVGRHNFLDVWLVLRPDGQICDVTLGHLREGRLSIEEIDALKAAEVKATLRGDLPLPKRGGCTSRR